MDWLSAFSDDQIALIGCVLALATAFAVMSLTWTVRQSLQPAKQAASAFKPHAAPQPVAADQQTRRRAA
ncbi:MAG: hypothetical protein ACK5Q5_09650 [Planctomycetaceae bacterium]